MELKQRTPEWIERRLGMVTASRFKSILTQPRTKAARLAGERSATSTTYQNDLLTEMLIGHPSDRFENDAMRWGTEWEPFAFAKAAESIRSTLKLEVRMPEGEFAFMEHPEYIGIGCSPDGVIGDDALLEIKCPYNPRVHLETVLAGEMPKEHMAQVQGSLWITGRKSYVFASYHDWFKNSLLGAPLFMRSVERDDTYIDNVLAPAVVNFRHVLDLAYEGLEQDFQVAVQAPF